MNNNRKQYPYRLSELGPIINKYVWNLRNLLLSLLLLLMLPRILSNNVHGNASLLLPARPGRHLLFTMHRRHNRALAASSNGGSCARQQTANYSRTTRDNSSQFTDGLNVGGVNRGRLHAIWYKQ